LLRAVGVGRDRGKQAEDFAAGEENQPREQYEHVRGVTEGAETPIGKSPKRKDDAHDDFATDDIGDPAEEPADDGAAAV
jgi:hypothetical protein